MAREVAAVGTESAPESAGAFVPPGTSRGAGPAHRPGPGECLAFCVAVAAVALHVLVDAFVFMERGVPRADHFVPGLVPVAILAAAVWLFPRLRAGFGAFVALVLGALVLVGFSVVLSGAHADGVGGLDWTGFLLAPAGVVLVGLGARLLSRTRRRDGSFARRLGRRALFAAGALVVLYYVVLPVNHGARRHAPASWRRPGTGRRRARSGGGRAHRRRARPVGTVRGGADGGGVASIDGVRRDWSAPPI